MLTFKFNGKTYKLNVVKPFVIKRLIAKGTESLVFNSGSGLVTKIMMVRQETVYTALEIKDVFPQIFDVKLMYCEDNYPVALILMGKMDLTIEQLKNSFRWKEIKNKVKENTINVLKRLHQQGYLMNDIELCNFMVSNNDMTNVKIVDFGRIIKCNDEKYFKMEIDRLLLKFY